MHWSARWVAAIAAALMIVAAAGAQEAVRYDNHVVVRAEVGSQKDLETIHSMGARLFGEAEGIGPVDYLLERSRLAELDASGIEHQVIIENLQAQISAERERLAAGAVAGGPWFLDFKDYAAVNAKLDEYAATRPDLATVFTVGMSLENRPIKGVRITGPGSDKPAVLIDGCQHAREWIAVMVPMYVADQLISLYDTDPVVAALVDELEWFIVPIVNPDGYVYSWGPDRLWRKNRRNNGDGTFGVDLNRNWSYQWGLDSGSSGDSGDETYRGPAPFSEPETQAMRDFYQSHPQIVSNIDFHSYGQLVLGPWGYTSAEVPPDNNLLQPLGDAMSASILSVHGETYVAGPAGPTLYLASGVIFDWAYGDQGVFSYTIELRPTGSPGFVLEPQEIIPTAEENFAAVTELADFSLQGVLFDFPQGLPQVLEADTATALAVTMTPITAPLVPGTGALRSRIGGAGPYASSPLAPAGGNLYTGTLPAAPCGETVQFYVEVETSGGGIHRSPSDAPQSVYLASSFEIDVAFADDFETNLGWTVANQALTDGPWDRGVPIPQSTCDRGNPDSDADGSGQCYLTDNSAANMCNSDVDGGTTTLTSPVMDASDPTATISYWRWYDNTGAGQGASPFNDVFVVDVSDNGGATWVNLETVGPAGPEVVGGWFQRSFLVSASGVGNTSQFQVRFSASDLGQGSVVEAAVDGVLLQSVFCPPEGCPWDLDNSGEVGITDFLSLLSLWGTSPGGPPDFDGNGVGITDFLELLSHWGACP